VFLLWLKNVKFVEKSLLLIFITKYIAVKNVETLRLLNMEEIANIAVLSLRVVIKNKNFAQYNVLIIIIMSQDIKIANAVEKNLEVVLVGINSVRVNVIAKAKRSLVKPNANIAEKNIYCNLLEII